MQTTTRLGLDVAQGVDNVSAWPVVDAQAKGILDAAVLVSEGTLGARPAANTVEKDHVYKATDTGQWFVGDGTSWYPILIGGAWQTVTPAAGIFVAVTPGIRQEGDVFRFKGLIKNISGSTWNTINPFATIPLAFAPTGSSYIYFNIPTDVAGTLVGQAKIDGSLLIVAGTWTNGAAMSLAGVTYTLS